MAYSTYGLALLTDAVKQDFGHGCFNIFFIIDHTDKRDDYDIL